MRDAALGKFKSVTFCSLISEVTTLTVRNHLCSYGNKSVENENVDSVETTSLSVSPSDVARGAVDTRDIYVTQALWACQQDPDEELKQKAWRRLAGIMKDQAVDEALFVGMPAPTCADVNPMHLIQCQNKLLSECVEMTQTDCQSDLAHAVHEQCPASAHHHCAGGWDSFNMKIARVLRNLSESQRLLEKSTTQLVDLVHKRCADVCPVLTPKDLSQTPQFKQMIFYMDACEVGPKCPGLLSDCKSLAVTARTWTSLLKQPYLQDRALLCCQPAAFSQWLQQVSLGVYPMRDAAWAADHCSVNTT